MFDQYKDVFTLQKMGSVFCRCRDRLYGKSEIRCTGDGDAEIENG